MYTRELWILLKLAIPLTVTGLIQALVYFFETLFLAHVSQDALAAGALVSWLFCTLTMILFGALSSINVLIAHHHGAKNERAIASVLRDGFILAFGLSLLVFILCWSMEPIFLLLGQSKTITQLAQSYLHAMSFGMLPDFLMIALLEFIMGLGHTRTIMIFSLLYVPINIIASYAFIFGAWGLPELGIAGAGLGMTISYWLTAGLLLWYVLHAPIYRPYRMHLWNFKGPSYVFELLHIGLPIGIMYCFEVAFFLSITLLMGRYGQAFLVANQVVMQYFSIFIGAVFSMVQAITIRIGFLLGADKKHSAGMVGYLGFYLVLGLMCIGGIVFFYLPEYLIALDFDLDAIDQHTVQLGMQFFKLAAIFMILEGGRIAFMAALRGFKDTRFPLITSVISFWLIALPTGIFLSNISGYQGIGLWYGMIFGAFISLVMLSWRFYFQSKNRAYN